LGSKNILSGDLVQREIQTLEGYCLPRSGEETIYRIPILIRAQVKTEHYIQILAEELTSSSSEEREHIEAEKKTKGKEAKGKETQDRPPQKKQEEKQEKGQAVEAKAVGEAKTQTPREKQLQT